MLKILWCHHHFSRIFSVPLPVYLSWVMMSYWITGPPKQSLYVFHVGEKWLLHFGDETQMPETTEKVVGVFSLNTWVAWWHRIQGNKRQNESSLSTKGPDYCEQTPTINPEAACFLDIRKYNSLIIRLSYAICSQAATEYKQMLCVSVCFAASHSFFAAGEVVCIDCVCERESVWECLLWAALLFDL